MLYITEVKWVVNVDRGIRVVKELKAIQKCNIMKKWKNMKTPHGGTYQREGMRFTYQHKALFIVNYNPV